MHENALFQFHILHKSARLFKLYEPVFLRIGHVDTPKFNLFKLKVPAPLPPGRKNDQLRNAKPDVVRVWVPLTLKFLKVEPYWKL